MTLARTSLRLAFAMLAPVTCAQAQEHAFYDPAQLPKITGTVAQYDLAPGGRLEGLILADGTELHVSPHLSTELAATVRPGDAIEAHGMAAQGLKLFEAWSVTDQQSGKTVVDRHGRGGEPHGFGGPPGFGPAGFGGPPGGFGPAGAGPNGPGHGPGPGPDHGAAQVTTGTVKAILHGVGGEPNGLLLANGTIVRLPPPAFGTNTALLRTGGVIAVAGHVETGVLGTLVMADQVGADRNSLKPVGPRPGPDDHGPGGRGPGGPDHGPGDHGPGDHGPGGPPPG